MKEYSIWIILLVGSINANRGSSLNIGRIFGLSNPFAAFHSSSNGGRNGGGSGSGPLGNDQGGDPSLAFPFVDFSYSKNYGFKVGRAFASGTNPILPNKTEQIKTVNDNVDVIGSNDGQFVNGIQVNGLNSDSISNPLLNGDESDIDIDASGQVRNNALGSHSALNANALNGGRQRGQGYSYQRQNGQGYQNNIPRQNGNSYNYQPQNGNSYNYQRQNGNLNGQRGRVQNGVNVAGRSNTNIPRNGQTTIQLQSGNYQTNSRLNYQRNSNIRSRVNNNNNNNNQAAILLRGDDGFDDGTNIGNNNDDNAFNIEDQNLNGPVQIDNNNNNNNDDDDNVGFSNGGSFNNGVDLRGGGGASINTGNSLKTNNNNNNNNNNNSNSNGNNNNNSNSNGKNFLDFPQKFQFLLTAFQPGNNDNNNNNNNNNNGGNNQNNNNGNTDSETGNNKKRSFSENGLPRNLPRQETIPLEQQHQQFRSRELPLFDNVGPQQNRDLPVPPVQNNNYNQGLAPRTRYVPVPVNLLNNKNQDYNKNNSKSEKKLITSNRDVVIRCPTGTNCVIYALSKSGFL